MLLGLTAVAQADQSEIAYIANDGRTIHVVESDGTGDHVEVTAPAVVSLAWSPDGKTLAYATLSTPFGPGIQRQSQRIFLLDATTGSSTELRSSTGTYGPIAFLPDGKQLAAQAGQGPTVICQGGIVSIALDTGRASPLASAGGCVEHLQVAPDGGGLIVTSHGGDPSSGVQNIALPDGASTWIEDPASGTLGFSGTVSADNQTLAYITVPGTDLRNPGQLVLTDRQGSNPRAVWPVQADQHLREVAFSPDGSQLAVGIRTGDTNDENIWVSGIDGSGTRTIASGRLPAWRPASNGVAMGAGATPPAAAPVAGGTAARVEEAHSPTCSPRCFTFVWIVQGDKLWDITIPAISSADLGKLQIGPELHGALVVTQPGPAKLVRLDDGTDVLKLYLVQGQSAWPVLPDQLTDDQVASQSKTQHSAGQLNGDIPAELLSVGGADQAPVASAPEPNPASGDQPAPDALTDSIRADILAAVDRANTAWTTASQSLDPSALDGNVAGQELSDDRAELDKLRSQGQTQTNSNTGFTVVDVSLDAPGHAIVHTQETWSAETRRSATGELVQRSGPTNYRETYTVEFLDGGWVVTRNDLS
jgi:WD40 repeat protein